MAKPLNDILKGVRKSKTAPPDIDQKNLYQWNSPDGVKFIKKHEIETHEYPQDAEAAFKGKKGGVDKTSKYKFQKDGVYEEAESEELDEKYEGFQKTKKELAAKGAKNPSALAAWIGRKKYGKEKFQAAAAKGKKLGEETSKCNHTGLGVMCEMHGTEKCPPGIEPKDVPKFGQKVLLDKKATVKEGRVEDVAHKKVTKQLSDLAKSANVPVTKLKPGKKQYNQLKSTGSMFGGARTMAAGLAKRDIEAGQRGSSVAKAIVKEDEVISEVAPPNPKIEKWIKANKERFIKEYGKEKGTQVLYAKAWKMHGQSESGDTTMQLNPAGSSSGVGPGGLLDLQRV